MFKRSGWRFFVAVAAAAWSLPGMAVWSAQGAATFDDDFEQKSWQEIAVELPAAPRTDDLIEFYVSAATDNRFWIDGNSLSVGADGVVRYTLVIDSKQGARNISYEGMRCETREQRIYASGRRDGSWSKSRNNEWGRVRELAGNRYHAALFTDYFCPDGVIARNVDEVRRAMRRGAVPSRSW